MDETTELSTTTNYAKLENELLAVFQSAFLPNDSRPIYTWAEDYVSLNSGYSITGKFDCGISPHFRKIFRSCQDPHIREVNILAPPRSGKTLIAEITLLHTISTGSGDVLWLQLSDEKASQMADLRMIPLLKSCEPVKNLIDVNNKYSITDGKFKFLHSTVHITSPKPNALNAVGYKYIFGDEVWKYQGGSIVKEIKRRTDDYKGVSKCLFFSQGGTKDSAWYEQYHSGLVHEYGWTCPKCSKLQRFVFQNKRSDGSYSGIVWPTNDVTRPNNRWNIKECARQARLECEHCRYQVTDDPQSRKYLLDTGDYIALPSDDFDPTIHSYRFTNLCNVKISFAELTTRFLLARQKQQFFGDSTDLEQFITKDLADFWDEYKKSDRVAIRLNNYDTAKPFGEFEAYRFLTIDCQDKEPFFYYTVRAWNNQGESRLVSYGTANTWGEIESIRDRNKVDYRFVFVDTGNGTKTESIYAECLKRGRYATLDGFEMWTCYNSLKGSGAKGFKHNDNKWYRYNEPVEIYATTEDDEGKTLLHYTWSNYRIKQVLETLRDGKGKKWEAADVSEEYTTHLNAEILQRKIKGNTEDFEYVCKPSTPNHWYDCEAMQIVAADIFNCLNCLSDNTDTTDSSKPETLD